MATKSTDPPAHLQTQMDELDALLDRLLKLPLGSGNESPIPPPASLKVIAPSEDFLESLDENLEEPILRFGDQVAAAASLSEPQSPAVSAPSIQHLNASQFASLPDSKDQVAPSLEAPAPQPLVPPEEMPWLDDEPGLQASGTKRPAHGDSAATSPGTRSGPIASERFGKPAGAQLEILIGPTCTVISPETLSPAGKAAESVTPHPSRLRTFFWRWNLLFDMTAGRVFPSLRRPSVKYFLGFVGLGLLIGSIYLAWHTWLK
jgi:hypothetical protein